MSGTAAVAGLAAASPRTFATQPGGPETAGDKHRGPCVISSFNGLRATGRAMELLRQGADPCEAVVGGVKIMEDDPDDDTVGFGGEPNEDGVVELDASVMHGPTHKSGAVAGLRNIMNPAAVALMVLRRTDHCLIVGEGALRFARAHGFVEENLLSEKARRAWLDWKENHSKQDDWLGDDEIDRWKSDPKEAKRIGEGPIAGAWPAAELRFHYGTVHCAAVDKDKDIGSCTSTSGLSWKIPGRIGDSPIIGAGNYCDNAVGAAGATGRGEATMTNLAAFSIVSEMERGATPTQACLTVAKRIADRTREKRNLDAKGRPNFDVKLYALRKDGAFGSASIYKGAKFSVDDGNGPRGVDCAFLFER
ncbi:MAG: N(4)-(beta-N-acetylglucosaminyl)-L-asparaginase, partial [Phycisphaerales bacterium]